MQVMIDIETLGNKPGAAIVSIGAVMFDPDAGMLDADYYCRILPASCTAAGLTIDADTVTWWLSQDAAAREVFAPGDDLLPLPHALAKLAEFIETANGIDTMVWARGSSFDFPLLAAAYRAVGMPVPWRYYNERDSRTVVKLTPDLVIERAGTYHNALDDARHQALHLMRALDQLKCTKGAATCIA